MSPWIRPPQYPRRPRAGGDPSFASDAEDKVVLDGNHPLAGMALRFDLKVLEVREATDEEIAHEHVHGAHGHHHGDEAD